MNARLDVSSACFSLFCCLCKSKRISADRQVGALSLAAPLQPNTSAVAVAVLTCHAGSGVSTLSTCRAVARRLLHPEKSRAGAVLPSGTKPIWRLVAASLSWPASV